MGNTNKHTCLLWRITLLVGLCGGIGGISIDADHILSAATDGTIPWAFLHQPITVIVLIGCVVASMAGLLLSLFLKEQK